MWAIQRYIIRNGLIDMGSYSWLNRKPKYCDIWVADKKRATLYKRFGNASRVKAWYVRMQCGMRWEYEVAEIIAEDKEA